MKKLDTFIYYDNTQLKMYLHQLPNYVSKRREIKNTAELSLTEPKVEMTIEDENESLTPFQEITLMEMLLKAENVIDTKRPKSMKEFDIRNIGYRFVHEKTTATKLFFPSSKIKELNCVDNISVWVSDPSPSDLSIENTDWSFPGTFLYLIEIAGDAGKHRMVMSGVSALLALSNIVHGRDIFDMSANNNGGEPFGRFNYIHPIEKLKSLGAVVLQEREIETLYRCRYITDEQSYTYNEKKYRVSDLLAYPIYIKELN